MSTAFDAGNGKITVPDIVSRKSNNSQSEKKKIVCLTAYDYPTARFVDEAGVDVVLVGDSLGMVVLGYENTLPLTMEEALHHTRVVLARACRCGRRPLLILMCLALRR